MTSSRNQPVLVVEQSVIEVKPMNTGCPAQPPEPPLTTLQAASRSTVVLVIELDAPVKIGPPAEPAGGQAALTVPL